MKIDSGLLAREHGMRHVSAAVTVGITDSIDTRDVGAHATGVNDNLLLGDVEMHL
jgi:hypothetical protein